MVVMSRAEVRIIDDQKEEVTEVKISAAEKEELLIKYGYESLSRETTPNTIDSNDMTFEEMCRMEEKRIRDERFITNQRKFGPKPISFDGDYYSNVNYDSDSVSGVSFKVSIVSNMEIPK